MKLEDYIIVIEELKSVIKRLDTLICRNERSITEDELTPKNMRLLKLKNENMFKRMKHLETVIPKLKKAYDFTKFSRSIINNPKNSISEVITGTLNAICKKANEKDIDAIEVEDSSSDIDCPSCGKEFHITIE